MIFQMCVKNLTETTQNGITSCTFVEIIIIIAAEVMGYFKTVGMSKTITISPSNCIRVNYI